MAVEIERRFLIPDERWRNAWRASGRESTALRQFYLAVGAGVTVRVRISDAAAAALTVKLGAGLSRGEFEYAIPIADAEALASGALGRIVEKRRHRVPLGDRTVEIDIYAGPLAPLAVAEIEIGSEAEALDLPDWLGREITGDPAYSNARLALDGLPAGFRPGDA